MRETDKKTTPESVYEDVVSGLDLEDIIREFGSASRDSDPAPDPGESAETGESAKTGESTKAGERTKAGESAEAGENQTPEAPPQRPAAKRVNPAALSEPEEPEPDASEPAAPAESSGTGPEEPTPAEDILDSISDGSGGEDGGDLELPKRRAKRQPLPRKTVLTLAGMALAAALAAAAIIPDLDDPAWSVLVISGLTVACVPMIVNSFDYFRNRGRVPTPLVMLASTVLYGCSGALAEATAAAVIYNIASCLFASFRDRELSGVRRRLTSLHTEGDGPLEERLEVTVREIDDGRVKAIVEERRFEWLTLLAVLGVAAFFSLIPPLFDGFSFLKWIGRGAAALSVCVFSGEARSLMIYLNGAEAAVASGVWFSDAGTLSAASEISSVVFNKTGTVTKGNYRVIHTDPVRISEEQLLYLAVQAGAYSDHALDRAIRAYARLTPDRNRILRHREQAGFGCFVQLDGETIVSIGNIDFMEKMGVKGDMYIPGETCVFVAVGRTCVGRIDFADTIKSDAITLVHDLKNVGVPNVAIMTGDNAASATNIARRLGITEIYSDCRPEEKAERLRYIQDTQLKGERAAFVSEAGHDLELLETANLSVTLGLGPEATGTFPDILIASGELPRLAGAVRIAKDVRRRVAVSFFASLAIRALVLILAVTGASPLWLCAFIMSALQIGSFFITNISME